MKSFRLVPALVGSSILSIVPCGLISQDRAQPQCSVGVVSVSLTGHTDFKQSIGNLTFEMKALKGVSGWMLSVQDGNGHDLICPINLPLRTCEAEQLGAGYGDTAQQALSHGRELRFLLNTSDYDRLEPYVERALSPSTEAESTRAINEYLDQSDNIRTGLLRITIVHADVSENDEVRLADLKLEFFAPSSFLFGTTLGSRRAACPEQIFPISERLPMRLPVANPEKYREIRQASKWMNPYLTINRDGFDLTFQGGRLFGPMSVLARSVVGLPNSVWPYGRVIGAQENGIRSPGDDAKITGNRETAEKILKELGLTVLWWPSG
jgi:hypothetical protein